MWSVRYEYNKVEAMEPIGCVDDIESILEPNSGLNYFITEWRAQEGNSYTLQLREGANVRELWLLKTALEDEKKIKLVDKKNSEEVQKTKDYRGLKGNGISAAFLYNKYWYLFGGRYYCRILLTNMTFEECIPIPFTDWIKDCKTEATKALKVPQQSKQSENKDISLYIIISVVVIILAVIVVVVIVIFIIQAVRSKKSVQTLS